MARIIGGIGTSHVPTIAMAFDKGKREDPDWKPLFQGYERVARWLDEKRPDVLFFCFNDHATSFFFDHYPTFALGVSEQYAIADEGLGPRRIPPLRGHAALSRHIARSLVDAEFDISIFQDVPLDHGLHSPLTMMWPSEPDWPGRVVPLVVNVEQLLALIVMLAPRAGAALNAKNALANAAPATNDVALDINVLYMLYSQKGAG